MDFFDFNFLDIFSGGSIEGGGIFDGLADGIGGLFEGGSEAAFEGVWAASARGGAGAAAEGGFAHLFRALGSSADVYIDYLIFKDLGGNSQQDQSWFNKAKQGEHITPELEAVRDVVKGHGFVLSQLREHKEVKGVAGILEEYETLGTKLPDEELLKRATRKLTSVLHPDRNNVDETLMQQLNTARDTLKDASKCEEYEKLRIEKPEVIEEIMEKLGKTDWRGAYEGARLRLEDLSKKPEIVSKFEEMSPKAKGGLIFAGVAGVGLLAYGGAKYMEKRRETQRAKPEDGQASWQDKINTADEKETELGLASQQR